MNLPSVEAAQEGDRPRLPLRERRIFSPSPRRESETLTLLFVPARSRASRRRRGRLRPQAFPRANPQAPKGDDYPA